MVIDSDRDGDGETHVVSSFIIAVLDSCGLEAWPVARARRSVVARGSRLVLVLALASAPRAHARTLEASTINRSPEHARASWGLMGRSRTVRGRERRGAARENVCRRTGTGEEKERHGRADARRAVGSLLREAGVLGFVLSKPCADNTDGADGRTDGAEEQMTRTTRTTRTRGWSCVACVGCFWVGA